MLVVGRTLTKLETLHVEFNNIDTFPHTCSQMRLKSLWLGNNYIKRLPHQLGRVTTLTDLSYGNNPLE